MKQKDLLVITSYPTKGKTHDNQTVGIASYAKNTIQALKLQPTNISILAEKINTQKTEIYQEQDATVIRIWKKNSLKTFFTLLKEIALHHWQTKHILFEFEVAMFGSTITLIALPIFLLLLRLLGKNVIFVFHQVITDITDLNGHIYIYNKGLKTTLLNISIQLFYRITLMLISKAVVFDEVLRNKLQQYGNKEKIVVIPHGVETFTQSITKTKAKKRIGIPTNNSVILSFGFLAFYKGTDWLIDAFANIPANKRKNITLVLAGGPNPNHKDKLSYLGYISKLKKQCKKYNIILTGFVIEQDIPLYFAVADLVVFPYRVLMSSSGPLSLAFSFNKPFILSEQLKDILQTSDIKTLIKKAKLQHNDMLFSLNNHGFERIIMQLRKKMLVKKITAISQLLAQKRSWETIGKMYYKTIYAE